MGRLIQDSRRVDALPSILLVDDDPVLCEIAATNLMTEGFDVLYVNDGDEALRQLQQRPFDLVITDIEMPTMSGIELTRQIRASATIGAMPVIVITGKNQSVAVDEAYSAGATSFLSKPLNWQLFTRSVRFVLSAAANEKALRQANIEAESANKLKQALLSNLSHEMRTPLNHIIGYAEILETKLKQLGLPSDASYAEYIRMGGRRLSAIVSDILLLSVAEADGIQLNDSIVPLHELLEDIVHSYKFELQMKGCNVSLTLDNAAVNLRVDRDKISQSLGGILDNAIKFSPAGSVIKIGFVQDRGSGEAMFFVQDQGPGVGEAFLSKIGTLFEQEKMGMQRPVEGLGIGLRLATLITQAHGGMLRYANLEEGGFMVVMSLPEARCSIMPSAKKNKAWS
ncbi:MAG: hybrid sensor histidine kinase/response regulator [bacterium]